VADDTTPNAWTHLLDKVPALFWALLADPAAGKSEWLHFTPRLAELYGVTPEEARDPRRLTTHVTGDDRAAYERSLAASLDTGAPFRWVGRVERKTGGARILEQDVYFERRPDGKVLCWGQTVDVTERTKSEERIAELGGRSVESVYRQIIELLPVGVLVATPEHRFPIANELHLSLTGGRVEGGESDLSAAYGLFMADGKTPFPIEKGGMVRALRGESVQDEVVMRNPRIASEVRMHYVWTPLRDADGAIYAALGTSQDITLQRALETELRTRNEQLAVSEEAKTELIDRLRRAVDELSNPILEVWDGVLAMPIIGVVDSRRTADMVSRLLAEVTRMQASFVIIDLTGVEVVDTKTADHLMKLMKKVEVVGARCVLTGIRPSVAETLVDIGVDFGRLVTLRNLKHGLGEALRLARRERDTLRDDLDDDAPGDAPRSRDRSRAAG
jgi:rsbT co-antagonist protein RsbR